MRARRGSVLRAWLVAHDATALVIALGVVTLVGVLHAWSSVPGVRGGRLPVWLLVPPLLALFAGLGATSAVPRLLWHEPAVRARLAWSLLVCLVAGAGGELVGASAAQPMLGASAAVMTGLVFGASVVLGRLAPVLAAVPIIVLLVQVHAARDLTPARIWDALPLAAQAAVWAGWALMLLLHARLGDRAAASD
ncbi:hypothetical protein ASE01_08505 [Nocardioides sp. Root190]|nr:hypothetical protein ASE01_08505 [Nocardioides sp. Root190]